MNAPSLVSAMVGANQKKYVRRGFSEQKAKVYALYELGYTKTYPETICRDLGIN